MAEDPICNMEVDEETAEFESQYCKSDILLLLSRMHKNNLNLGQNNTRVQYR